MKSAIVRKSYQTPGQISSPVIPRRVSGHKFPLSDKPSNISSLCSDECIKENRECEKNTEKCNKREIIGESLEKPPEVSVSRNQPGLILTSPEGKVRDLLNRNQSYRKSLILSPTRISKSEFWLPKANVHNVDFESETFTTTRNNALEEQIEIPDCQQKKSVIPNDGDIREFLETTRPSGVNYANTSRFLHATKTLNGWVAVQQGKVLQVGERGVVKVILISEIEFIMVDKDYLVLYVVVVPTVSRETEERPKELVVLTGDPCKTESIMTSVLFASSRTKLNVKTTDPNFPQGNVQLRTISCFREISILKKIMEKEIQENEVILFCGLAQVETVLSETRINDDIMMQYGTEKYQPVNLNLVGSCLKIIPTYTILCDKVLELDTSEIASLNRREEPRPHTLQIIWRSQSINLSASNFLTTDELLGRLRRHKDAVKVLEKQPVYIVLTVNLVSLYSAESIQLLLQIPTINLILMGKESPTSLFLANEATEANEATCSAGNTCCWKISFFKESHCEQFLKYIYSREEIK